MALTIRPLPTGDGMYQIEAPGIGARQVRIIEWREDDKYDTAQLASGPVTAGTELTYFRDLNGKELQHTNLKTPRKLPAQEEMIATRIGVHLSQAHGNVILDANDLLKFAHAAVLIFKIGERTVVEGPVLKYASGYGVAGTSGFDSGGTRPAIATIGQAAQSAAPQLLVAQTIQGDKHELDSVIRFPNVNTATFAGIAMPTFAQAIAPQVYVHGLLRKPA